MIVLSHATVGSNRPEEARVFYDALLGLAGMSPMGDQPAGGRIYGKNGAMTFGVLVPQDKNPATIGNGTMVAFRCETRAEVDAFYAKALALGGTDEGAPGERAPGAYYSYFRDLDGNKFCAFSLG